MAKAALKTVSYLPAQSMLVYSPKTMKNIVKDYIKVFILQEEMNMIFPYLKLEFFVRTHDQREEAFKKLSRHNIRSLVKCNHAKNGREILLYPAMTVAELAQDIREVYDLEIKLFRKSGKAWLGTTLTDSWSLQEQNAEGEALSRDKN